jgi:CheY-like chemotaxis protein
LRYLFVAVVGLRGVQSQINDPELISADVFRFLLHSMSQILIVDDDEELLETTSSVLELGGYDVSCSGSGPDALRQAATAVPISLVLLDVRMEGMDGIEVLSQLKEQQRELPVVMMTAFALESVELDAYRLGAYTLVRKPFEPDAMLKLVDRAARRPAVMIAGAPADGADGRGRELQAALISAGHRAILTQGEDDSLAAAQTDFSDVAIITNPVSGNLVNSLMRINPDLRVLYSTQSPPPPGTLSSACSASVTSEWNPGLTKGDVLRTVAGLRGRGVTV